MGEGLVMEIVDAEIFREGKKLPCWRKTWGFTKGGNDEIEKQNREVCGQNTEGAPHIKAANRRPAAVRIRPQ